MNYINLSKEVLQKEINSLQHALSKIDSGMERAVQIISASSGRVITSGIGKSGIIAQKIASTLTSIGTPAVFLHPVEAFHGNIGIVQKNDIGLFLSRSGETKEIIDLFHSLKSTGQPIIGLIGKKESTLARYCDVFLDCSVEEEACPFNLAPTSSSIVAMAMGDALSICLMKSRKFSPEKYASFHPAGSLGKRLHLTVKNIMCTDFPRAKMGTPMRDILIELTSKLKGAVLIIEDKTLKGIYTDGDLKRTIQIKKNFLDDPVVTYMSSNPVVIDEDKKAIEALYLMETKGILNLPVVNKDEIVIGLISMHDIIKTGIT